MHRDVGRGQSTFTFIGRYVGISEAFIWRTFFFLWEYSKRLSGGLPLNWGEVEINSVHVNTRLNFRLGNEVVTHLTDF